MPTTSTDIRPIRVLLVEDNLAHARAIGEGLCANLHDRFDLVCADRMSGGLEALARGRVDLVLLDLNLPDSNGLATFERFHRAAPQVPVVIMTGVDDPTLGQHAVAAGARDVLVKGQIEPTLLARVIQHTVERQRFEAIQRSQSRPQGSLFDRTLEAMVMLDDEFRCLAANSAASMLLGRPVSQIKGRSMSELLMLPEDWPSLWSRWREAGVMDGSSQYVRPDGLVGDMDLSITPQCLPTGHLMVMRDVSIRRRTEERLRSSSEQWKALAQRHKCEADRLAELQGLVGRELRQILKQLDVGGKTSAGRKRHSAEGWAAMLRNTLTVLERGAGSPGSAVLGPLEALRSQTIDFQKRTGIQCTLSGKLPGRSGIEAPATHLCPILEQALSNVAVHGSATAIQVRLRREGGRLVLEIEDNGQSLTESQLADARTFRLSGVREQVLRFGGDFTLQGLPGKGTMLRVWLPSEKPPRVLRPAKAP